jgi:hypothetical protein
LFLSTRGSGAGGEAESGVTLAGSSLAAFDDAAVLPGYPARSAGPWRCAWPVYGVSRHARAAHSVAAVRCCRSRAACKLH